jgi:flavodoxin
MYRRFNKFEKIKLLKWQLLIEETYVRTIVLYSSKGGNTGKVADAIASELKCESIKITRTNLPGIVNLNGYDLIFVGTGIHYGNPNEDLIAYLKTINLETTKWFSFFITWGGAGKTNQDVVTKLKTLLESKGQKIIENSYFCYGGWNFLRRGHPNAEEIKAAKNWAKKIVSSNK